MHQIENVLPAQNYDKHGATGNLKQTTICHVTNLPVLRKQQSQVRHRHMEPNTSHQFEEKWNFARFCPLSSGNGMIKRFQIYKRSNAEHSGKKIQVFEVTKKRWLKFPLFRIILISTLQNQFFSHFTQFHVFLQRRRGTIIVSRVLLDAKMLFELG